MTLYLELPDALSQIDYLGLHIRDVGLLQGSLARPQTTLYGEDAYPTLAEKAAALFHSIVTSHPMRDSNKRTGWTLMITFLKFNDYEVIADTEDALKFILGVADGRLDLSAIAAWLEAHLHFAPVN